MKIEDWSSAKTTPALYRQPKELTGVAILSTYR